MKNLYLFLLTGILWFPLIAEKSDYSPVPIHEMILSADLAVYGTIDSITNHHFFLKIKKKCFGEYKDSIIRIKQFHNWTCAQRWTDYKTGQTIFLFLIKDNNKEWKIMSAGGEGEFPISDRNIYVHSCYSIDMSFIHYERADSTGKGNSSKFIAFEIDGAYFPGVKLRLDEFSVAVSELRNCFRFIKGKISEENKIELICSKDQMEAYKNRSNYNKWLAKKCLK
jgi:hypothetical protein